MDTLRGNFDALDDSRGSGPAEDESGREAPPASIGQDERRMQVRAYNHWASLLEDRNFPSIDDLDPAALPDFGPYSVLLDFTRGIDNPAISYLGEQVARECDISVAELSTLADVPSRSLLSRITDHYMQILANQAPIGFEAEFVNQRGATILYRGILLPYSSDDEAIDFIYGVINWKELADQHTSDELLLQVDQALEQKPEPSAKRIDSAPLTDWADGPVAVANDLDDPLDLGGTELDDNPFSPGFVEGLPAFSGRAEDYLDDDEFEDEGEDGDESLPRPRFGSLMSIGGGRGLAQNDLDDEDDDDAGEASLVSGRDSFDDAAPLDLEYADHEGFSLAGFEPIGEEPTAVSGVLALAAADPASMELGDWLAAAREMATQACTSEDRTRNALYEAIGRAYDFSLAAAERPEDFQTLLADSGLKAQERAPMTPVVKLVFGADYDKTRVTEYAAALSHAHRLELPRGSLGDFLRGAEGGLKGVVRAERQLRRQESGKEGAEDAREALAATLREMPGIALDAIEPSGSEFALVMIRRSEAGDIALLGEVPEDAALIEKAARKLVG